MLLSLHLKRKYVLMLFLLYFITYAEVEISKRLNMIKYRPNV